LCCTARCLPGVPAILRRLGYLLRLVYPLNGWLIRSVIGADLPPLICWCWFGLFEDPLTVPVRWNSGVTCRDGALFYTAVAPRLLRCHHLFLPLRILRTYLPTVPFYLPCVTLFVLVHLHHLYAPLRIPSSLPPPACNNVLLRWPALVEPCYYPMPISAVPSHGCTLRLVGGLRAALLLPLPFACTTCLRWMVVLGWVTG